MNTAVDGHLLQHEVHGEGAPVLLVHGFPLSREMWRPLVPLLSDRFRLILPDLRGHGASAPSARVTMAEFADDLARLLDDVGESRPVTLVGMSMGGYVAFEFCRRHEARLKALALTNTRARADTEDEARGRRETAVRVLREGSAIVAEAMLAKLFAPEAPEILRDRWRTIMAATPPAGVAAALEAMATRQDSFTTLRRLACPVQIVAGALDPITPPDDSRRMHEASPGSRLAILEGTAHMTAVEAPERFAATLIDFLDSVG